MDSAQASALEVALTLMELAMVDHDGDGYGAEELVIAAHSYVSMAVSGFHTIDSAPEFAAKVYADMAMQQFMTVH